MESESVGEEPMDDMADVEEGEIRHNSSYEHECRNNIQNPVESRDREIPTDGPTSTPVGCKKSSEFQSVMEGQKSHELLRNVETCNLHGEGGHVPHGFINVDGSGEELNKSTDHNIPEDGGPDILNPADNLSGPNNLFGDEGPTPAGNLGKRNREERSPPSLGSMQGPAQRPVFHVQIPLGGQIDLNSPLGDRNGLEEMLNGSPGLDEDGQNIGVQSEGDVGLGVAPDEINARPDHFQSSSLSLEVEETIKIGSRIGINLNGFESATEELIVEEGVNNCL
ncbi:hypothetical protein Hanom_Chr17g01569741 [Helianthus anomalus]